MPIDPTNGAARSVFFSVFFRVALPMAMAMADLSMLSTVLPTIGADLGDLDRLSLVVAGYAAAAAISAPAYGRLSDGYGRRRLMLVAIAIYGLGALICLAATSLPTLLAARFLQGIGGGGLMALGHAMIGEALTPRERARFQGYIATLIVTANSLAPLTAGFLVDFAGWRSIFLLGGSLAAISFCLVWTFPPKYIAGPHKRFDFLGFALFTAFVFALLGFVDALRSLVSSHPAHLLVWLAATVGAAFLLVRVERQRREALLPLGILFSPSVWRASAAAACHGGATIALFVNIPIYMRLAHGLSSSEIGVALAPIAIGTCLGSVATGTLVAITGRTAIFPAVGLSIMTAVIGSLALLLPMPPPQQLGFIIGATTIFGGTVMGVVQVTVLAATIPEHYGASAAAVQYSRSLGSAFFAALSTCVFVTTLVATSGLSGDVAIRLLSVGESVSLVGDLAMARMGAELALRSSLSVVALACALGASAMWTLPMRRIES
ncbi:MFS transporter [Microvirga zambiensis]|uniref:MFS transporter n=1 Tax=Microvirga zambiensis TaxID=1402137 RepID=UPI00191EF61B|nr:MFS transporter [Microvirga zambiensis]